MAANLSIVGTPNVTMQAAVAAGSEARGSAIAAAMLVELKAQSGALVRFLGEILNLDHAGRKAFRVAVEAFLKKTRAQVELMEGTPEHAVYKRTSASASARMSEAKTFSRACDAGYVPEDLKAGSYHHQVSLARQYLDAEAASQTDADGNVVTPVGPTRRRGRQATPFIDKVKNLVTKESPSIEAIKQAAELLQTMAQLQAAKAA